jgi:hypothetical protein
MSLQETIEAAWERRAELSPAKADAATRAAVDEVIAGLDDGSLLQLFRQYLPYQHKYTKFLQGK